MQFDLGFISFKFREGDYVVSEHALEQMDQRGIGIDLLVEAIGRDNPAIIETGDYKCLICGWGASNEPLHAVVAMGTQDIEYDRPRLVTTYRPDRDTEERWEDNYARRKRPLCR